MDYAEMDEEDFYGQPFETEGYVSIWIAVVDLSSMPAETEPIQDWCGVGHYDLDSHEQNHENFDEVKVRGLLAPLSYSKSFIDGACDAATATKIDSATWVMAQYDFAYDPSKVKRATSETAIFLGVFPFSRG